MSCMSVMIILLMYPHPQAYRLRAFAVSSAKVGGYSRTYGMRCCEYGSVWLRISHQLLAIIEFWSVAAL